MSSNGENDVQSAEKEIDDKFPLWKYATKIEKAGAKKGGNCKFRCNLCNGNYNGSYSRVSAHLLKIKNAGIGLCPKVTPSVKLEIERILREAEERTKPVQVPLPNFSSQDGSFASQRINNFQPNKRRAGEISEIEKAFNIDKRDHLTSEIARMFYSAGLPFHLAKNPHFISAFTYAANNKISGFVPPGYNTLRTTLLQRERVHVERLLEPIKGTWKEKWVSIVSDGWTDAQRRPLINVLAVTESGPMFLKAVNCEGEVKDKEFIANILNETIAEVGPQNVVQVITDNVAVCKAAGSLVQSKYKHIFWTPCVVHTLNLALKNICTPKNIASNAETYEECHWINIVVDDIILIRNFINNHAMRLAMYKEFVNLRLLKVASTRFASAVVMLKRFRLIKQGLLALVVSEEWSSYRDDDVGKAQFVKQTILNDMWWDRVDYIIAFTNPIYDMLRFADTDKPVLHLMYDIWEVMMENVKKTIYRLEKKEEDEDCPFYNVVAKILTFRWNKSISPIHCMAHSLNPKYYSSVWLDGDPRRVPPHKDLAISEQRNKCLRSYFPNSEDRQKVILEYASFSGATDAFSTFDFLHDRGVLDPNTWWLFYGSSASMLQNLALRLLAQPCSSSCSERNWSTYSFIHSMKRNKIEPQRAEDLVFTHSNLRLISRKSESYTKGESRMWDISGDAFDPFDGVGELEVANLSLDEPELEAVLFDEDNIDE